MSKDGVKIALCVHGVRSRRISHAASPCIATITLYCNCNIGPLPMTEKQNEYIMVIGDYFTKWKEAFALQDHTAQTVADVL